MNTGGPMASNAADDRTMTSRRAVIGAAVVGVGALALPSGTIVDAAVGSADAQRFMAASHLLVQHQLSPTVGARLAKLLAGAIPTFDSDVAAIAATARSRDAKTVEEFFDALPDGSVRTTAHRIIFGWYAGVIDDSPTAELVAFEQALMYQPTRDAVALPTYGFNGPDRWTDVDPPLSAMPEF